MKDLLSEKRLRTSGRNHDGRNEIESDFGRIIFSPAIRRMHDKTQVFPLTTDDNIHSRLTHSNEVMSIGHTLGLKVANDENLLGKLGLKGESDIFRKIPVLLQNICLIHDIGNPPFGHHAETIIQEYFKNLDDLKFNTLSEEQKNDFIHFDGNAQGLRVLTKLQTIGDSFGLNLTYSTLAASIKYPHFKEPIKKDASGYSISNKKQGVFHSEKVYFEKIFKELELMNGDNAFRHPLCYLMEAADSIAYKTMDIEDAYNKGLVSLNDLEEILLKIKANAERDSLEIPSQINMVLDLLSNSDKHLATYKIVNFRILLIGYFVDLAYTNFRDSIDEIIAGSHNSELIDEDKFEVGKLLQNLTNEKIFTAREINSMEVTGASVIKGIFEFYRENLFHENKKVRSRAETLISNSVKSCAIEENYVYLLRESEEFTNNKSKYEERVNKLQHLLEENTAGKETVDLKDELWRELKPQFSDLPIYFKWKVIVDFVSGMTDQFALSHYQMINGSKNRF